MPEEYGGTTRREREMRTEQECEQKKWDARKLTLTKSRKEMTACKRAEMCEFMGRNREQGRMGRVKKARADAKPHQTGGGAVPLHQVRRLVPLRHPHRLGLLLRRKRHSKKAWKKWRERERERGSKDANKCRWRARVTWETKEGAKSGARTDGKS